jgi:poly-gamma-glutamate synthesis protein (capsule biosynthesis protein)
MRLLFMGDIMGHDAQIEAAYDSVSGTYQYDDVFEKISPLIKKADFAIANLEVTLAGEPYMGYPQFSSPDVFASACKKSGINVLLNANNHACDRRKQGILRTIETLDSLHILHTGSFADPIDRQMNNLLILEKNSIRIGILNYTYGTNGIPAGEPTIINLIDSTQMAKDIQEAENDSLDKLIMVLHWGKEYQSIPNEQQKQLAKFLFAKGVDIIIGSHPHVIQPMEYDSATPATKEHFIAYSMGNFISNQRTKPRDGGAMIQLTLKKDSTCVISQKAYYLTWVNKYKQNGKSKFQILPAAKYEKIQDDLLSEEAKYKLNVFLKNSRALLDTNNREVKELTE